MENSEAIDKLITRLEQIALRSNYASSFDLGDMIREAIQDFKNSN